MQFNLFNGWYNIIKKNLKLLYFGGIVATSENNGHT